MKRLNTIIVFVAVITPLPFDAFAWNIPGHMLSGTIAYQILQRKTPKNLAAIRSTLENNPWYETHWRVQLDKLPQAERDEMLFMLAARWADDIRTLERSPRKSLARILLYNSRAQELPNSCSPFRWRW
jgi:hypothetical protein